MVPLGEGGVSSTVDILAGKEAARGRALWARRRALFYH